MCPHASRCSGGFIKQDGQTELQNSVSPLKNLLRVFLWISARTLRADLLSHQDEALSRSRISPRILDDQPYCSGLKEC